MKKYPHQRTSGAHVIRLQTTQSVALYNDRRCAVQVDNTLMDWFKSTGGVRQGCLLSLYLLDIFLGQIMTEALESFQKTAVLINGRPITNLSIVEDIDLITDSTEKLTDLTERLEKALGHMGSGGFRKCEAWGQKHLRGPHPL